MRSVDYLDSSIFNVIENVERFKARTVYFYENLNSALPFFKHYMANNQKLNILLFSKTSLRTLKLVSKYLNFDLKSKNIILITRNKNAEGADVVFRYDEERELIEYLGKLSDALLILGRGHLSVMYDEKCGSWIGFLFELIEAVNDDVAIYAFTPSRAHAEIEVSKTSSLFDVAILLKKQEELFAFGEEIYEFHVIQSMIPEISPGTAHYKITRDMEIEEI